MELIAQGQDIYAVTATLIVESVNRILSGKVASKGVKTLGEAFDASDFLNSLQEDDIKITMVEKSYVKS